MDQNEGFGVTRRTPRHFAGCRLPALPGPLPCGRHILALMLGDRPVIGQGDRLEPLYRFASVPRQRSPPWRSLLRDARMSKNGRRTTPRRTRASSRTRPVTASRATAPPPTFTPSCSARRRTEAAPATATAATHADSARDGVDCTPAGSTRDCVGSTQQVNPTAAVRPATATASATPGRFSPHPLPSKSRNSRLRHSLRPSPTFPSAMASQPTGRRPISTPRCLDPGAATASKREKLR